MMKILGWVVTSVFALGIVGMVFIHFNPDYRLSVVRSGSMTPAILTGDIIITGPVNGVVKPGEVITYQHGKDTITHRVLSVNGETITTKGDALQHPDPWTVTMSDVRGAYIFKIPFIGYALSFIKTKTGWFMTIIIPTVVLIGWLCRDILKEAFSDDSKQANKEEVVPIAKQKIARKSAPATSIRPQSDTRLRQYLINALNNTQKT